MIDIITVTTHDAKRLAAELARLLEAEEHKVRMMVGRSSQTEIEAARTSRDAVLIIWSADAPSQIYMREWLRQIDASRLVEISTAQGYPERKDRKAPVIDFANWRGERGGRAWNALNERLRAVTRAIEPPKPPARHAAVALGVVSFAVVGVAMGVRSNEAPLTPAPTEAPHEVAQLEAPTVAVGGATYAMEPASADDVARVPPLRPLRAQQIELEPLEFAALGDDPLPDVRDPTLIERLQQTLFSSNDQPNNL